MVIEVIKDAILQNIGTLKPAPKNWNKRHCMLCHTQGHTKDTRNRFGIQFNPQSIAVNCFNCGFSAGYKDNEPLSKSFKFFLKHIGVSDKFISQVDFEAFKAKNNIDNIREGSPDKPVMSAEEKFKSLFHQWHTRELPDGSLPITEWLEHGLDDPNFLQVVNYALSRRIFDLDKMYWCPGTEKNLNQRLIIPYYYRKRIVGFTSRLSYDADNKVIPKYYQQCPTDFVFNLDNQQDWFRKYVIVTEGVLDAWVTDGVATLGEINQTKIDIINRLQKQVIVSTDRDKTGGLLVDAALENNWAVSFPKWDNNIKDASSAVEKYGRLLTVQSIISSAITGKEKIQLYWDIESNERRKRQRN